MDKDLSLLRTGGGWVTVEKIAETLGSTIPEIDPKTFG